MVRVGFLASSASGAAASNPMKARIAKTEPAITPLKPVNPSAVACSVVKTDSVLLSPASMIIQTASAAKTTISNRPSTVPAPALSRMPNQPKASTSTAATTVAIGHQVSNDQPYSAARVPATTLAKMR